uniref:Uncharacterized protein n=1 Tax=viral metagenome TaxID=1070528 RepID=A0A6C0C746_9ZZZZ
MFFVVKNNIDKNGGYVSGEIVAHASDVAPENMLENAVLAFVAYTKGQEMIENMKIIDAHSLNQVAEPLVDTILLYRIISEPNQIHVYQRISRQVPGYVFGQSIVPEFTRIKIFELVKYAAEVELPIETKTPTVETLDIEVLIDEESAQTDEIKPIQVLIDEESAQADEIKPIQVEMHPSIIVEQIESVCKNSDILKLRPMDLMASLESSPKFLRMKEKND